MFKCYYTVCFYIISVHNHIESKRDPSENLSSHKMSTNNHEKSATLRNHEPEKKEE